MAVYETNYAEETADNLKEMAMLNILKNAYCSSEDDPVLRSRVAEAYKEISGAAIDHGDFIISPGAPLFLHGAPGQGKTSLIKDAARSVAKMLDMNFVSEPNEFPGTNDFVFVLYETSGILSSTEFGGIPTIETIKMTPDWKEKGLVDEGAQEEFEVLSKKALKQFEALNRSRIGVIVFDDASNASKNVQNALLSLCEEKKFQSSSIGKHTTGFLTGNIGTDGTYVIDPSSALLNRTSSYYVEDTVPNWVSRETAKMSDSIGLAGINAFLKHAPETFSERSTKRGGSSTPFASPRSWSKFLTGLREWMNIYNQNPARAKLSSLKGTAQSMLGPAVGEKVVGFYHAYIVGASKAANDFLEKGKASEASLKNIKANYGEGHGAAAQDFGYAFSSTLAEAGASALVNSYINGGIDEFNTSLTKVANGLTVVCNDFPMVGFMINRLNERILSLIKSNDNCDIELQSNTLCPFVMREAMATKFSEAKIDGEILQSILSGENKIISRKK